MQARKLEKLKATNPAGDTFKVVALEWFDKQAAQWSEAHAERSKRQLERDLFPWIGDGGWPRSSRWSCWRRFARWRNAARWRRQTGA